MASFSEISRHCVPESYTNMRVNTDIQDVRILSVSLAKEYKKFVQNKIMYEFLQECLNDDTVLDYKIKSKIEEIITGTNCRQKSKLGEQSDEASSNLFGITCWQNTDLDYEEAEKVKLVVDSKIVERISKLQVEFKEATNCDLNLVMLSMTSSKDHSTLCDEDRILAKYYQQLTKEQMDYIENLLKLNNLLEKATEVRLQQVPSTCDKIMTEYKVSSSINRLKSVMAQNKVEVGIFMETSQCIEAYKDLMKDIKAQQDECIREIASLNNYKEEYKNVKCKQFDEILDSYLQYKNSVEKKKLLYGCKM